MGSQQLQKVNISQKNQSTEGADGDVAWNSVAGLPSLTRFACDTREYVFSHAHTQMNENHTRIGKLAEKC